MHLVPHLPGMFVLLAALPGAVLPWRFFAEDVRLEIGRDTLRVAGEYWFRRETGGAAALPIFYPFPADSLLGEPWMESLEAERRGSWVPLAYQKRGPAGVLWLVSAAESDTVRVRVRYGQRLLGSYARYIVTTALAWGEPLDQARFEVCLPEGSRSPVFTLPLRAAAGSPCCYAATLLSFVPGEDLVVRWLLP